MPPFYDPPLRNIEHTATVMLATILQSAPSRTCIPVFRSTTRLLLSNCRICTPYVNTDATIFTFHRAANAEQSHTSTDATILRFTAAKCRTHCVSVMLATRLQPAPSRTWHTCFSIHDTSAAFELLPHLLHCLTPYVNTAATISTFHRAANTAQTAAVTPAATIHGIPAESDLFQRSWCLSPAAVPFRNLTISKFAYYD